ncbi:MAG: hypothetical protein AMXMBFR36_20000 [Acidobacteriota bacterium]
MLRLSIMARTLRDFLGGYQRGIEVCVAGSASDQLLGVREAFRRFFHDGLDRPVPVAVVPHDDDGPRRGLAASDAEAVESARSAARRLEAALPGTYHFYIASEFCVAPIEIAGAERWFVRAWSAVVGPGGEAWGSSGAVQLPDRMIEGLSGAEIALAAPGTRRAGGTISALTGGLETRRSAVALATVHALSTLFYGVLESRPGLPR